MDGGEMLRFRKNRRCPECRRPVRGLRVARVRFVWQPRRVAATYHRACARLVTAVWGGDVARGTTFAAEGRTW